MTAHTHIGATVLGYPRIGRNRELKRALEAYWSGRTDGAELDRQATDVRQDALKTMTAAGLTSIPVNTFSWYDQMLDTAVMVGAIPKRFTAIASDHRLAGFDAARYFAMARGTAEVPPMEMTKWFDTNYHYLVPEIGPDTDFNLHADKPLAELSEARAYDVGARPVVVGPYTFLALAKASEDAPGGFDPLSRLGDLTQVYIDLLRALSEAGASWVQFDEPALVSDLTESQVEDVRRTYELLAAAPERPSIMVATYFGNPAEAVPALASTQIDAIGLDVVRGPAAADIAHIDGLAGKTLVLGAINGRNIWRADLRATLDLVRSWRGLSDSLAVASSCPLLHVPYDVTVETGIDSQLREILAFADQKLDEVVAVHGALDSGEPAGSEAFIASDAAVAHRRQIPGLHRDDVATRMAAITDADRSRESQDERTAAQSARLGLPPLPTTTIGSFPQTTSVRKARADLRAGRIDEDTYTDTMRQEVRDVIALQSDLGLDVLVHGEPERNDMVQYFAEQLEGYLATAHGWVQSYGSRCVRPPILYGDIHRGHTMTVEWTTFAQSLTDKPVKGMLTGPVTMLAWSFVRDDQPRAVTADQLALALRDEVADLEDAGIGIIQVDEPALRELLPVRRAEQAEYLHWSVESFRLATSGIDVATQLHTHLCYSEFGEIIDAIDGLDADVTSVEAARSRMELLADVAEHGFSGAIGPGVYDIHSPRIPNENEIAGLVTRALDSLPADKLWINPDCGLKTRGYDEVEPALAAMVAAAHRARSTLHG